MIELSVIVPTFNRKEILVNRTLPALMSQNFAPQAYEIIIVDDGSTDGTEPLLREKSQQLPDKIRYFRQPNQGPAAARNLGIRHAVGKIIVMIGDDIEPVSSDFLQTHFRLHTERFPEENIAVLGYVTWAPDLEITPFMLWLENGGPQFAYYKIQRGEPVDYRYFYTSNISLKKSFLQKTEAYFSEKFPYAAYEDIELGYRLQNKGLRIVFHPEIVGYHVHPTSLEASIRRMKVVGYSLTIVGEVAPAMFSLLLPAPRLKDKIRWFLGANVLVVRFILLPVAKLIEKYWVIAPIYTLIHEYYWKTAFEQERREKSERLDSLKE